ncbi:MAG: TrkA family potassium uptake protein [Planctomycetia bacterium]|nr:TrkA family potassium uptake protein [Planctomycetia bacterium]MBL6914763.1 TrkA family potassium uptake protein [Planctomycetota bacterium]
MTKKRIGVFGLGQFGTSLISFLKSHDAEIKAMDRDVEKVAAVVDDCHDAVALDLKDQKKVNAELKNLDILIITVGESPLPAILLSALKDELNIGRIICRAHGSTTEKILLKIGIEKTDIFSPETEAAKDMARKLTTPYSVDNLPLSADEEIWNVEIPKNWDGHSIKDLDIRKKYAVNLICIQRKDMTTYDFAPTPDLVLQTGDKVHLLGKKDRLGEILKHIEG